MYKVKLKNGETQRCFDSFKEEIKETEHQIMVLKWVLEDEENDN